ncbi:MAG: T9SS type A sorting domain-containing protein, partial [Bacteroidota bacterium]|nr:T9SS type A sorting domain-containing protein [Bacteroidota bacterium]
NAGWNMVSIPDTVRSPSTEEIYPPYITSIISYPFKYNNGRYEEAYELYPGIGYWVKFGSSENIIYRGVPVYKCTANVQEGWNLIGSLMQNIPASKVIFQNTTRTSNFFEYTGSYVPSDILIPGKGYWVKVSQAGKIILNINSNSYTAPVANSPVPPNPPCEQPVPPTPTLSGTTVLHNGLRFPHLTWTSSGSSVTYRLYLYMCYTGFEDCYGENSSICIYSGPNLSFTDYYIAVGHKLSTRRAYYFVVAVNTCNETSGNSNKMSYAVGTTGDFIQGRDSNVDENVLLPLNTELLDCYPNPFNPQTTIRYTLAEPAHVKLVVLNTLGQEVAALVDEMQEAGYKSVTFNAENLSSGLYIYKLTAGASTGLTFTDVKKMIVVK